MFERSAGYYDHFYSFLDYEAAGERLRGLIRERYPSARSLLGRGLWHRPPPRTPAASP
jgi:hypothetical protein